MKTRLFLSSLLLCLPLAACGEGGSPSTASKTAAETESIGQKVQAATDKARTEMAKGNINISDEHNNKAEITPQGDLLINGQAVTIDAQQRALLLDYRRQVEKLAGAGMDIGVAGAQLGVKAAGEALRGVFSGNTEGIEAKVNAEADKIKEQAQTLCRLLPEMMAKQQALAAVLPAFKPYATMDQSDIDDCHA